MEDEELKSPKFANWKIKFFKAKAEIERLKIDIKNEKNWGKIQTKQAVKDTAKEIFTELKAKKQYEYIAYTDDEYCVSQYEIEKLFKERYDVEVE